MNGAQIRNILSSDTAAKKYFIGIFTSDRLPKDNIPYPSCFVLNTDIEGGAGLHWLAVILKSSEELEFFDSFGRHPKDINTDIYKYIQKFKSAIYNKVQIQSPDSEVCGAYCVYYLFHRCRGLCMDSVLSTFGNIKNTNIYERAGHERAPKKIDFTRKYLLVHTEPVAKVQVTNSYMRALGLNLATPTSIRANLARKTGRMWFSWRSTGCAGNYEHLYRGRGK